MGDMTSESKMQVMLAQEEKLLEKAIYESKRRLQLLDENLAKAANLARLKAELKKQKELIEEKQQKLDCILLNLVDDDEDVMIDKNEINASVNEELYQKRVLFVIPEESEPSESEIINSYDEMVNTYDAEAERYAFIFDI
jgi:hypothetical protein